jgi:pterin-4a-carbinolamine dehydratase
MDTHNDPVSRAEKALYDIQELADSTAEHHPYWALLYNCSQISKLILEKWNDELTEEDLSEIRWMISELENSYDKLMDKTTEQDSKDK